MPDVKVKVCGITNFADAKLCIDCGADYLGFVFAESPRKVTAEKVRDISDKIDKINLRNRVKFVGVFVNSTVPEIEKIVVAANIDEVQLHGDEDVSFAKSLNLSWYRALRIKTADDVDKLFAEWSCNKIIVDAKHSKLYGGTGSVIDRNVAVYAKQIAVRLNKLFFLAGGIDYKNVYSVLSEVNPYGIDVSSGLEESYGKKSADKVVKFFKEVTKYKNS